MTALQKATRDWVTAVRKFYEGLDRSDLTSVFMRGYWAGSSEREVAELADRLYENEEKFPARKEGDDGRTE
jgi:hypothetical protein